MKIIHVSVVVKPENAQDSDMQDIIEVLEALHTLDSTSVIVTDSALSAIASIAGILSPTEQSLLDDTEMSKSKH